MSLHCKCLKNAYSEQCGHCLQSSLQCGFDFIAVPLVHPRFRRPRLEPGGAAPPFTRSDLLLTSSQWSSQVSCCLTIFCHAFIQISPHKASRLCRTESCDAVQEDVQLFFLCSKQAPCNSTDKFSSENLSHLCCFCVEARYTVLHLGNKAQSLTSRWLGHALRGFVRKLRSLYFVMLHSLQLVCCQAL